MHPLRLPYLTVILAIALTGCATITTVTPDGLETTRSIEEFESYVESVFRRQNQALVEAGHLLEADLSVSDRNALEAAENDMLRACRALNQVASDKMDQRDSGLFLEIEVRDTIGECDFATRKLEQQIADLE